MADSELKARQEVHDRRLVKALTARVKAGD